MIDKDGKIRGKINIIDPLVVVIILVVIAFVVYRSFSLKGADDTDNDPVIIEFTCPEADDYTVEQLEVGVPVLDAGTGNDLGVLTGFELGDPISYTLADSGQTVNLSRPDCKSVVLTFECEVTVDDNGFVLNGSRYGIGHSTVVYVGKCRLSGKVSGIDPA